MFMYNAKSFDSAREKKKNQKWKHKNLKWYSFKREGLEKVDVVKAVRSMTVMVEEWKTDRKVTYSITLYKMPYRAMINQLHPPTHQWIKYYRYAPFRSLIITHLQSIGNQTVNHKSTQPLQQNKHFFF